MLNCYLFAYKLSNTFFNYKSINDRTCKCCSDNPNDGLYLQFVHVLVVSEVLPHRQVEKVDCERDFAQELAESQP